MKKPQKFFLVIAIIFGLIFFTKSLSAWAVEPYFDLSIKVSTNSADGVFDFDLHTYIPGIGAPVQEKSFSILAASSTGEYLVNATLEEDTLIILDWQEKPDWEISNWNCASDNTEISFSENDAGSIQINGAPYSQVFCELHFAEMEKNPVIIVPGILASRLNRNDDEKTELWPNLERIIWNLGRDSFLDELALNQIGEINLANPLALPTDIIRSIGPKDYFAGLISELAVSGYVEGENIFVFPYDWRLDIRDSVNDLPSAILTTLEKKIADVLAQTGAEKVDIIAHSMGGLLIKYYLQNTGGESKINKFIDIATPHLGAPNAFKILFAGDDLGIKFGFLGLNSLEVKKISKNMTSLYQLLPSENYFSDSLPDYRYYIFDMIDYDEDGTRGRLSFEQSVQFMKNTGANGVLLDIPTKIHNSLDSLDTRPLSAEVINIVGCGTPTIGKIFIQGRDARGPIVDLAFVSGDGTVPERSARSFTADSEYQFSRLKHAEIPSADGVKELVSDILLGGEINSESDENCELADSDLYSVHGPVLMEIPEEAEPIQVEQIYDNGFLVLQAGETPEIKITATSTGHFSAKRKKLRRGQIVSTDYFANIPIPSASSSFSFEAGDSDLNFRIINNDSGLEILPNASLDHDSVLDLEPPETYAEIQTSATSSVVIFSTSDDTVLTFYSTSSPAEFITGTSTIITVPGTTTLQYYSIDSSGNYENEKTFSVVRPEETVNNGDQSEPTPMATVRENTENNNKGGSSNSNKKREVSSAEPLTSQEIVLVEPVIPDSRIVEAANDVSVSEDVQIDAPSVVAVQEISSVENIISPTYALASVVETSNLYTSPIRKMLIWFVFALLILIGLFAVEQHLFKK